MTFTQWKFFNGFSTDNCTYIVVGGNTYAIKEDLKLYNFKYNSLLLWHTSHPECRLPPPFTYIKIRFEEVYCWGAQGAIPLQNAESIVLSKIKQFIYSPESYYYGTVGERIRKRPAIYLTSYAFDKYDVFYIHKFIIDKSMLVWTTGKSIILPYNTPILLSATIKDHLVYNNTKITKVNRCVLTF